MTLLIGFSMSHGSCAESVGTGQMRAEFQAPPLRYQSRPLWFWNGQLEADKTKAMVAACKTAGYCGMGILPCKDMGFDFMTPGFLSQYKVAVDVYPGLLGNCFSGEGRCKSRCPDRRAGEKGVDARRVFQQSFLQIVFWIIHA